MQVDQYNEHYFNISRPYINKKESDFAKFELYPGDDIVSIKDLSVKGDSEDAQIGLIYWTIIRIRGGNLVLQLLLEHMKY